jgi:hypothetical protein
LLFKITAKMFRYHAQARRAAIHCVELF